MNQINLASEATQEHGFFHGRVSAANNRDELLSEEEAVAGGAPRDTVAAEFFFSWQTEFAVGGSGCQNHCLGLEGLASSGFHNLDVALEVNLDDVIQENFGAEALGLGLHVGHQVRAHQAIWKARKVFDIGGLHELATGFYRRSDHERL